MESTVDPRKEFVFDEESIAHAVLTASAYMNDEFRCFSVEKKINSTDAQITTLFQVEVEKELTERTEVVRRELEEMLQFVNVCCQMLDRTDIEKSDTLNKSSAFGVFTVAATETLECLKVLGLWPTYRV